MPGRDTAAPKGKMVGIGGPAAKLKAYAVLAAPSIPKRMAPGSFSTVGGLKAV